MKKKHILIALLITPLFLAVAAPVPESKQEEYNDFIINNVHYSPSTIEGCKLFSLEVTNTGDGYLDIYKSFISSNNGSEYEIDYEYDFRCIRPHSTTLIKGITNDSDSSELKMTCYGYTNQIALENYKFTCSETPKENEATSEGETLYRYWFDVEYKMPDYDYDYSIFIDYSINGKEYSYYHPYTAQTFDIISEEKVPPEEIHFDGISLVRGRYVGGIKFKNNLLAYGLIALLTLGFFLLIGGIIIAFVLVLYLPKKHKKTGKA